MSPTNSIKGLVHDLSPVKAKQVGSLQSVLKSLSEDIFPTRFFKQVDEDLLAKMAEPLRDHLNARTIYNRDAIDAIFSRSGIPAAELATKFAAMDVNLDNFFMMFENRVLTPDDITTLRQAYKYYKSAMNRETPMTKISNQVKNVVFLKRLPGDPGFSKPELAYRQAEVALATRDRNSLSYLNNVLRADQQDLLSRLKGKLSTGYLATLVKEWIPDVKRKDQIMMASVVMQLAREQEAILTKAKIRYDKTLFTQNAKHVDELMKELVSNLQNNYDREFQALADHLKSIVLLNLHYYSTLSQIANLERIATNLEIPKNDLIAYLAKFKITNEESIALFQRKELSRYDGILLSNAWKFYEKAGDGVLKTKNEKRLVKEILKIFKGIPRSNRRTQDLGRRAKIVESANDRKALEFLKTVFKI